MDLYSREYVMRVKHRHNDGTWGELAPASARHDPASHDPERSWEDGQLFVCTTCDEQVRIATDDGRAARD